MTLSEGLDDSFIFAVQLQRLLDEVRAFGSGNPSDVGVGRILARCGLVHNEALTEAGRALFKVAWVLRQQDDATRMLGQALRVLTPLQVIDQELRGLGPIPEAGVLDLLRQHGAVGLDETVESLRPTFRWLSSAGVLAYSLKLKTVRSLAAAPDVALAGEIESMAAMISPKSPYLNLVRLRRLLRRLDGVVWWADPHFGTRGLEELAEEVDPTKVSSIRIISGDGESVVSPKSLRDFGRFREEMMIKGVNAEWRVDGRQTRNWHDRWIAGESQTWNVPPINTLLKNDYSEITPASERPPFHEWWERSVPR